VLVREPPCRGPGSDRPLMFQQDTVFPMDARAANVEFALKVKGCAEVGTPSISDRLARRDRFDAFADSGREIFRAA